MIVTSTLRMQLDAAGFVKSAAQVAEAVDRDVKHLHDLKTALRDTGASEKLQASMVKLGASTQHIEGMRRAMAEFRKEQGTTGKAWADLTKEQKAALRTFESATAATMRAVITEERDLTTALKREADQRHEALLSKERRMRDAILADAQKSEDRRVAMLAAAKLSHVAIAKREAVAKAVIEREITANLKTEIKAREGASEAELATMRRIAGLERDARVKAIHAETAAIVAARDKQHAAGGVHGDGRHFDKSTVGGLIGFTVAHEFEEGARKAIEVYREFDKERRYGGVVMNLDFEQQRDLVMQAIRGGGSSKFNDIQWLESQREFSARGYAKEQVLGFTPVAKDLAQALDKTMPEAVRLMEGSLMGFHKDVSTQTKAMEAARRTADLEVKIAKVSGMTPDDIEALYKRGAGPAYGAGVSEEKLLAFGGVLKKSNFGGDEASTAFRAMVVGLQSPTAEARTAMQAAGVDFSKYQSAPKKMDTAGFVQEVARKYGVQLDHNTIGQLDSLFSNKEALADPSAFTPAVTQLLRSSLGGKDAKSLKSIAGLASRYRDASVGHVDVDRLLDDLIPKLGTSPGIANAIFGGKNGSKIFAAFSDPDLYKKLLEELRNESQGYAAKVSEARMAGFDGAMSMLQGAVFNLDSALGRAFDRDGQGGLLAGVTRGAAGLTQALAEADPAVLRMGTVAAGAVTAFAGLKAAGWISGGFGLNTAAAALEGSAVALDAAAARLGVAGAASTTGGAAVAGGGAAAAATGVTAAGLLARALPPVALTYMAIEAGNYEKNRADETARTWNTPEAQALPDLGEQTFLQRLWGIVPKGKPIVAGPEKILPVPDAPKESGDDTNEWEDAPGHADGGIITGRGGPRSDNIPIRVSPGEAIIPADVVRANLPLIQGLISRRSLIESGVLRSDGLSRAASLGASTASGAVTRVAIATDSSSAAALREVVGEGMYDALRRIRNEGDGSSEGSGSGNLRFGRGADGSYRDTPGGRATGGSGASAYGTGTVKGGNSGIGPGDGTATTQASGPGFTSGMRARNLGNIGYFGQKSPGLIGPSNSHDVDHSIALYATQEDGIRAAARLALHKYQSGMRNTATLIAAKKGGWTPGALGPGASVNIARAMGLSNQDDLHLDDPAQMRKFLHGLAMQEHGSAGAYYTPEMIDRALSGKGATTDTGPQAAVGPKGTYPAWMDERSKRELSGVNGALARDFLAASDATGLHFRVTQGLRTQAEADANARSGRGVSNSQHLYGAAADIVMQDASGNDIRDRAAYKRFADAFTAHSRATGGNARWLGDLPGRWGSDIVHFDQGIGYGQNHRRDPYGSGGPTAADIAAGNKEIFSGPDNPFLHKPRDAERAVLPQKPPAGASAAPQASIGLDHSPILAAIEHVDTLHRKLQGLKGVASVDINHRHRHEGELGGASRPGALRTSLNGHYGSDGRSWS